MKFNIIQAYSMLTQFIHLYRPQFCHSGVRQATIRGTRDVIVVHPIEELGLSKELNDLANSEE